MDFFGGLLQNNFEGVYLISASKFCKVNAFGMGRRCSGVGF